FNGRDNFVQRTSSQQFFLWSSASIRYNLVKKQHELCNGDARAISVDDCLSHLCITSPWTIRHQEVIFGGIHHKAVIMITVIVVIHLDYLSSLRHATSVSVCGAIYEAPPKHDNLNQRLMTTRHTHNCIQYRLPTLPIATAWPVSILFGIRCFVTLFKNTTVISCRLVVERLQRNRQTQVFTCDLHGIAEDVLTTFVHTSPPSSLLTTYRSSRTLSGVPITPHEIWKRCQCLKPRKTLKRSVKSGKHHELSRTEASVVWTYCSLKCVIVHRTTEDWQPSKTVTDPGEVSINNVNICLRQPDELFTLVGRARGDRNTSLHVNTVWWLSCVIQLFFNIWTSFKHSNENGLHPLFLTRLARPPDSSRKLDTRIVRKNTGRNFVDLCAFDCSTHRCNDYQRRNASLPCNDNVTSRGDEMFAMNVFSLTNRTATIGKNWDTNSSLKSKLFIFKKSLVLTTFLGILNNCPTFTLVMLSAVKIAAPKMVAVCRPSKMFYPSKRGSLKRFLAKRMPHDINVGLVEPVRDFKNLSETVEKCEWTQGPWLFLTVPSSYLPRLSASQRAWYADTVSKYFIKFIRRAGVKTNIMLMRTDKPQQASVSLTADHTLSRLHRTRRLQSCNTTGSVLGDSTTFCQTHIGFKIQFGLSLCTGLEGEQKDIPEWKTLMNLTFTMFFIAFSANCVSVISTETSVLVNNSTLQIDPSTSPSMKRPIRSGPIIQSLINSDLFGSLLQPYVYRFRFTDHRLRYSVFYTRTHRTE
ncbi:hypothetical protein CLF_108377, partial [Clonorchis sinensis]